MPSFYKKLTRELNLLIHTLWFCLIKGPAALMSLAVFVYLIFNPSEMATVTVSLATRNFNPEYIIDLVASWFLISSVLLGLNLSHRYLTRRGGASAEHEALKA